MSFIEVESWEIAEGNEAAHHEMIRAWFDFVRAHRRELFPEWKSARYFREVDREGVPTGRYVMLFEFHTLEGHHAYKERRKEWSGPYAAYKQVDPYDLFDHESVRLEFWEPMEVALWLDDPAANRPEGQEGGGLMKGGSTG